MMTIHLSFSQEAAASFGEKALLGGGVTAIGLAVVFLALGALIFITYLYPKIVQKLLTGEPKSKKEKARKSDRKAETVSAAPVKSAAKAQDDTALIAVITAAVAASLGAPTNGIVIKSISRAVQNAPAWGKRGRTEQIYNRL